MSPRAQWSALVSLPSSKIETIIVSVSLVAVRMKHESRHVVKEQRAAVEQST